MGRPLNIIYSFECLLFISWNELDFIHEKRKSYQIYTLLRSFLLFFFFKLIDKITKYYQIDWIERILFVFEQKFLIKIKKNNKQVKFQSRFWLSVDFNFQLESPILCLFLKMSESLQWRLLHNWNFNHTVHLRPILIPVQVLQYRWKRSVPKKEPILCTHKHT